MQQCREGWKEE